MSDKQGFKDKGTTEASVYSSKVSSWISAFYFGTLFFLIALMFLIPFKSEMSFSESQTFYLIFSAIIALFLYLIYCLYNTEYRLSSQTLKYKSLTGWKKIDLSEIKLVKPTVIPLGFRVFGASLLGGSFYLPGIGWTEMMMTNFSDGVLIKTEDGSNYVFTPENPFQFIKQIKE